jgi:hypothetical protein
VLIDQRAVFAADEAVDSERVDSEMLAHRNIPAAPLDLVEVRHFPVPIVIHRITSKASGHMHQPSVYPPEARLAKHATQQRPTASAITSVDVLQGVVR